MFWNDVSHSSVPEVLPLLHLMKNGMHLSLRLIGSFGFLGIPPSYGVDFFRVSFNVTRTHYIS